MVKKRFLRCLYESVYTSSSQTKNIIVFKMLYFIRVNAMFPTELTQSVQYYKLHFLYIFHQRRKYRT